MERRGRGAVEAKLRFRPSDNRRKSDDDGRRGVCVWDKPDSPCVSKMTECTTLSLLRSCPAVLVQDDSGARSVHYVQRRRAVRRSTGKLRNVPQAWAMKSHCHQYCRWWFPRCSCIGTLRCRCRCTLTPNWSSSRLLIDTPLVLLVLSTAMLDDDADEDDEECKRKPLLVDYCRCCIDPNKQLSRSRK